MQRWHDERAVAVVTEHRGDHIDLAAETYAFANTCIALLTFIHAGSFAVVAVIVLFIEPASWAIS